MLQWLSLTFTPTNQNSPQDRFAALWRGGRLLVEDPNALDVINNKTSFGELLMTYTLRMRRVS